MAEEKTEQEGKPPEEGEPAEEAAEKKGEEAGEGKEEPEVSEEESSSSQIQVAQDLVKEMKKQNSIMTDNLKKAEKLTAEQLLGGTIPAGQENIKMTKDEKEIAAAKELLKGTGFEDMFDQTK